MKKLFGEFKAFISRGNVLDMAVGVIIGSAFTAIVNSLVNDIFMPLLGVLTGGLDFSSLTIKLASDEAIQAAIDAGKTPAMLKYGSFIAAIINFLLIALVIFAVTKTISALRERAKKTGTAGGREGEAAVPLLQKRNCRGRNSLPTLHFYVGTSATGRNCSIGISKNPFGIKLE